MEGLQWPYSLTEEDWALGRGLRQFAVQLNSAPVERSLTVKIDLSAAMLTISAFCTVESFVVTLHDWPIFQEKGSCSGVG